MEQAVQAIQAGRKTASKYAWVILAVVWLAGFTAPANMAKVIVLAPVLAQVLGMNVAQIGWAISLFMVLGFVLAFPAASLTNRFGVRATIVLSVVCGAAGSLLGVLSNNVTLFMVSRFLEGAGMGFMGVAGPAAITPWFPKETRGRAMGIWATWVAVAMFVCPIIYAWIAKVSTWQTVWWVNLGLDIVVLVLFLLLYKKPSITFEEEIEIEAKPRLGDVLRVPALWLLAGAFMLDELVFMSINGFQTTYLTGPVGASLSKAALIVSLGAVAGVVFSILGGVISDKLKTRKWILVIALITGVIYGAAAFNVQSLGVWVGLAIFAGIAGGVVPAMVFASAQELVKPSQGPSAMALAVFGQNLGMTVGPMMIGGLITSMGWSRVSLFVLCPIYIVGTVLALAIKKLR